jgi:seryl-tRNA synthetase
MLDIRRIRSEPETVKAGLARRAFEDGDAVVDEVLQQDVRRREASGRVDELKATRNEVSRRIGEMKKAGESADAVIAEMRQVGDRIDALDTEITDSEGRIRDLLLSIPNLPEDDVSEGGEEDGDVMREWGTRREFGFQPEPHWEVGAALDILDLPRGAKVSGSGFPLLKGQGARLQRVLIDFMIDLHVREHGYHELRVPYLVTPETMTGTGQLPKFAEESYVAERDDLWLIPTAEVPVTNLHRDEILGPEEMPVRYTAYSPCFRREAGAAGKDTRGLLRVHQFDKVELVRYETPSRSRQALEELTAEAESVLQILDLPYRVVRLATGDLGFSSAMTYDLEVWAPGVERWLEVSSCSTFTDYQARRANLRFRSAAGHKPEFVHTLNGSALALPRLMVALLETYQEEDGSVTVPEPLRDRMGVDRLTAASEGAGVS